MLMTREQLQELMPEYVAGELDLAARTRFETSLERHPDLRAEARSLCDAADALRSLNDDRNKLGRADASGPNRRIAFAVLRYAAVIALAFITGYGLRGGRSAVAPSTIEPVLVMSLNAESLAAPQTEFEKRLIEGYARGGSAGTNLGRSLMALAHAVDTTRR